jgi:hypothetical protein
VVGVNPWLSFLDFPAADAGGAHSQLAGAAIDARMHRAQVDVPASLAHVVGVADGISGLRPLAAHIANSCHDRSDFLMIAKA